eukprot:COSAG01_NODE_18823_length_1050_cov_6.047319_2_plen_260_part_01
MPLPATSLLTTARAPAKTAALSAKMWLEPSLELCLPGAAENVPLAEFASHGAWSLGGVCRVCQSAVEARNAGLAVFSLSNNERAGPKDRKYDPSRSHYKKVSLLRDRLLSVPHRPSFIPPSWRGPLGSRRPKKAIAFSGGVSWWVPRSAPVGLLRGFPFWAFRLWWVRESHRSHPSTRLRALGEDNQAAYCRQARASSEHRAERTWVSDKHCLSWWVPRSAPVGLLRGFPFWAFRLWWVRACYAPTTPQQQHNNTTPTPT